MPAARVGSTEEEVTAIHSRKANRASLERLRDEIDALDRRLFTVIAERMALVTDIGGLKRKLGLPTSDPVREAQLKARLKERTAGVLEPRHIEELSTAILRVSRDLQAGAETVSQD